MSSDRYYAVAVCCLCCFSCLSVELTLHCATGCEPSRLPRALLPVFFEYRLKDVVLPPLSSEATGEEIQMWFEHVELAINASDAQRAFSSDDTSYKHMWLALIKLPSSSDHRLSQRFDSRDYPTCGVLFAALKAGLRASTMPQKTLLPKRTLSQIILAERQYAQRYTVCLSSWDILSSA
jgi:hypothetical protein